MSSSISVQTTKNEGAAVDDSISDRENVKEKLLKELDEVYSAVLRLMKLFGLFVGDTKLARLKNASGRCKRWIYLQGIYCGVVISGVWLLFIMSVFDVVFANNIYLFLMFAFWFLLIPLCGTISLIVLCVPLGKSRFQNFLTNLISIDRNVNLEKVKIKSKKGIIVFCFFFISATVAVIITNEVMNMSMAAVKPWNQWFGFKILAVIFSIFGVGMWLLPILFFYITCLTLEELFDDLYRQMSSLHSVSVNIATFKTEYYRLCEVVEFADKMLGPLLLGMVSLYIPLICFNLYMSVNLPEQDKYLFLGSNLFWLVTAASVLVIIMWCGSKVCEKVHFVYNYCKNLLFVICYSVITISVLCLNFFIHNKIKFCHFSGAKRPVLVNELSILVSLFAYKPNPTAGQIS